MTRTEEEEARQTRRSGTGLLARRPVTPSGSQERLRRGGCTQLDKFPLGEACSGLRADNDAPCAVASRVRCPRRYVSNWEQEKEVEVLGASLNCRTPPPRCWAWADAMAPDTAHCLMRLHAAGHDMTHFVPFSLQTCSKIALPPAAKQRGLRGASQRQPRQTGPGLHFPDSVATRFGSNGDT